MAGEIVGRKRKRDEVDKARNEAESTGLEAEEAKVLVQQLENVLETNKILLEMLNKKLKERAAAQLHKRQKVLAEIQPSKRIQKEQKADTGERIVFHSRRTPLDDLKQIFGNNLEIVDVSTKGSFKELHPGFPVSCVPIPNSSKTAVSVLGVYEGLKVFEKESTQVMTMAVDKMKGIRRPETKKTGKLKGYQYGLGSNQVLSEKEARYKIFLPCYLHVLENSAYVKDHLEHLKDILKNEPDKRIVLVDQKVPNTDINDLSQPISHCPLIRDYLMDAWPSQP